MQNLLAESSSVKLKPGKSEIQTGDGRVRYEREIRLINAKTARGEVLPGLYEIVIKASWKSAGRDHSGSAALTVYQP
jgi:hypothetical protein